MYNEGSNIANSIFLFLLLPAMRLVATLAKRNYLWQWFYNYEKGGFRVISLAMDPVSNDLIVSIYRNNSPDRLVAICPAQPFVLGQEVVELASYSEIRGLPFSSFNLVTDTHGFHIPLLIVNKLHLFSANNFSNLGVGLPFFDA